LSAALNTDSKVLRLVMPLAIGVLVE
jgi:hypothetical protein